MAKQTGLGDALYVSGYNLSGDSNDVQISCTIGEMDQTGMDAEGMERAGGIRDSKITWESFFNPTRAHPVLSALSTSQQLATYCRSTALGAPAFWHLSHQVGYDPSRGSDGSLLIDLESIGAQWGGEWGFQLTAGSRTDTSATNGASVDDYGAGTALGLQASLHLLACTAVDLTITVQDSPDDSAWSDLISFTPVATGSAPTWERIATGPTESVDRYLRIATTTSGGMTTAIFQVAVNRNLT